MMTKLKELNILSSTADSSKQPNTQRNAIVRVCASCEWIFRYPSKPFYETSSPWDCPKCGWPSYGARFVYDDKAYRYEVTQQPWFERKMNNYADSLHNEIVKDSK